MSIPKIVEKEEILNNKLLDGKTFCITGKLSVKRSELEELISSLGGKVTGSVSSKTDYLINNDSTSESSKNRTAKSLGIPIITEQEFQNNFLK